MQVGDWIKWSWYLDTGWEQTHFLGVIMGIQTEPESHIFDVFLTDGSMCEVNETQDGLERIA